MNLLEVRDLSIQFSGKENSRFAIKNMNFSLAKGETLGIVGESGSGKTVTAMSIMKLLPSNAQYHSGSVNWIENGKSTDFLPLTEDEIRPYRGAKVSMIFQEPMSALNPVLSCGYQVAEALLAHNICSKKEVRGRVLHWFQKVGLSDENRMYDSYPHQLSGGQLQRILIALALVCEPELVIADEPTTALDVRIQKQILELLKSLKESLGLTIIFISHDLGVIKSLCNRILVMQNGQIVEEGTTDQIFNHSQKPYTQGLIACRPPLKLKLKRLPTVQDFLEGKDKSDFYNDINITNSTEIDRSLQILEKEKPILKITNLNIQYPKKKNWFGRVTEWNDAAKNINLDIYPGEVIGLVGESGSGKTSIGRSILGLTPCKSGSVRYKDKELLDLSPRDWRPLRKEMQIIFQDPFSALNPRKKIGSSITEPMKIHKLYASEKERKENAIHLLEEVGMPPDSFERYPHQFSGGQRQRICIARALSLKPRFIVCDESVSALDVSVQAQVLNLLKDLKTKFDLSYLFITHDLSVVHFIADRIAVIQSGEIVEFGKSYEILLNPQQIYTQQLIEAIPG